MTVTLTRREVNSSLAGSAFAGLLASGCVTRSGEGDRPPGYGALIEDTAGLIDLPPNFTYRIISSVGDRMDDGEPVPDMADGMGAFAAPRGRVVLVRNHEISAGESTLAGAAFDRWDGSGALSGGTTTLIYDPATARIEAQYRSLAGTIRNCAGGTTPWRTWLTCEEDVSPRGGSLGRDHGWVFEVPADLRTRANPVPLTAMGRFNHEAAAVDPRTGIVYLTEDRDDSLFYRFIPDRPGQLAAGRLQALAMSDGRRDSRNWMSAEFQPQRPATARWIDLTGVDSSSDDLRLRGAAAGALLFARGEGVHMGRGEVYFTCTSGGAARLGQVMRYRPGSGRLAGGTLDLFFESTSTAQFHYGDNLTIGPNGHLFVCEDQPTDIVDNHIRGIGADGTAYPFARMRLQTELAGACFAPDGRTLFVNAQSPTKTIAIKGPFV